LVEFRRLFRFRLKTFLVITSILSFSIAYWSIMRHQRLVQLEFISSLNGNAVAKIYCDLDGVPRPPTFQKDAWFAKTKNIVLEPLSEIVFIDLSDSLVEDGELTRLIEFDQLIRLDLSNTRVSDHAVTELLKLKNLKFVNLSETRVTSKGVEELKRLKSNLFVEHSREFTLVLGCMHEFKKKWKQKGDESEFGISPDTDTEAKNELKPPSLPVSENTPW